MPLTIMELDKKLHDRQGFNCGNEARDNYLKKLASQHARKNLSRTFVLIDTVAPGRILGYYSVSAAQADADELPEELATSLPKFPIPAARMGQLAVDQKYQGRGYGGLLISNAVKRALVAQGTMGIYLLLVDADSDDAVEFYRHYGFTGCNSRERVLFLPLGKRA